MCTITESSSTFQTEWRRFYTAKLVGKMDMVEFGVKAVYLIGSVESYGAGKCSDIDLIIQLIGDAKPKASLVEWLQKWDARLCQISELYTSKELSRLLDIHFVNDKDIQEASCFATKMLLLFGRTYYRI